LGPTPVGFDRQVLQTEVERTLRVFIIAAQRRGTRQSMFFFFSNRLGCLGSIVVSVAATILLLFLFGLLRF
jgi:hypothetical protein